MKLSKKQLSLEDGITKEWVITNGIGGFASQSVLGINTRKYHGLLIAPLMPPARRYVILSKIDESIEINEKEEILYSNICKNYISEGYKKLESFEKVYIPIFNYQTEDGIKIEKQISMVYGKNVVCIYYKVENTDKDITMKVAPIMNYRDFHCMNTNHDYNVNQKIMQNKKTVLSKVEYTPIYVLDNGEKAENRYELIDMKGTAKAYANGNTKIVKKDTYNKLLDGLKLLERIIK